MVVHESGYAFLSASVSAVIGKWSYDESSFTLTLLHEDPRLKKTQSIRFRFSPDEHSYTFIGDKDGGSVDRNGTLHFITDDIPDKLVQALEDYPQWLKKEKRRIRYKEQRDQEYQENLEREKPEFERILRSISEDPKQMLSPEFYSRADTPATRAIQQVLRDWSTTIPEDVLIGLLEQLPSENHWIRVQVFSRPELSAITIQKFYPRALEWGRLNSSILSALARHPNTPMVLVEELATSQELAIGIVQTAQQRIQEHVEAMLAGEGLIDENSLRHFYELAKRMPKAAYMDTGSEILALLASYPETPPSVQELLSESGHVGVQLALVRHKDLPQGALERLSVSTSWMVRERVAKRPDLPASALLALSRDMKTSVREAIAENPFVPAETLESMRSDTSDLVREKLVLNPNAPDSVIEHLANDEDPRIRSMARLELKTRRK